MTYAAEVLADNPIHYWRFDEPGPTAALWDVGSAPLPIMEDGSHGLVLTGYGGPGGGGSAWTHGGWTGYIGPDFLVDVRGGSPTAFSFEVWLWLTRWEAAASVITEQSSSGTEQWRLRVLTTGIVEATTVAGGTGTTVNTGAYAVDNESWHQLGFTHDGSTLSVFLNGYVWASAAAALPGSPTQRYTLAGNIGGGTNNPSGWIAEAAIYPTALDPARILAHYSAADLTVPPKLIGPVGMSPDVSAILSAVRRTY